MPRTCLDEAAPPKGVHDLVVIGGSAGALGEMRMLLRLLPADLPAVILMTLHRSSEKPSDLRDVLAMGSALPVRIARHGERLEYGVCYIGEPARHLTLDARLHAALVPGPSHLHRGTTIDLLFNSAAAHGGSRVIGVILSGLLRDGSRGLKAINHAHGLVMVQLPSDAEQASMPQSAIDFDGPIDCIASTPKLAQRLAGMIFGSSRPAERPRAPAEP